MIAIKSKFLSKQCISYVRAFLTGTTLIGYLQAYMECSSYKAVKTCSSFTTELRNEIWKQCLLPYVLWPSWNKGDKLGFNFPQGPNSLLFSDFSKTFGCC